MSKDISGMNCPVCGKGRLEKTDNITSEIGGYTFVEKGHVCPKCKEEFIPEEESKRTIDAAIKLGAWETQPMKISRKLTKTARGIIFRIPNDVQKSMYLTGDEGIELSWSKDKIVLEVVRHHEPVRQVQIRKAPHRQTYPSA